LGTEHRTKLRLRIIPSLPLKSVLLLRGHYGGSEVGGLVGYFGGGQIIDSNAVGDVNGSGYGVGGFIGNSEGTINIESCYACGNVEGYEGVGGLVGSFDYGEGNVVDCYATGDVSGIGFGAGGLAGGCDAEISFERCWACGDVNGGEFDTGGLIGPLSEGSILECYASGNVTGEDLVGGLTGSTGSGTRIERSFSTGSVYGLEEVGGLTAGGGAYIKDCYSLGNVTGLNKWTGGLVGISSETVINCYAAGLVDGSEVTGGLAGGSSPTYSVYTKCFWDQTKNPDVNGLGEGSDPNVIDLPTEEMQRRATFADAGWDMINVWDIGENQTYPFLRKHLPSDFNKDGETNLYDLAIVAQNWLEKW
jgi:hypothetical protein